MLRVNELIRFLKEFPSDAHAYAYEGEVSGIVIMSKNKRHTLGVAHNSGEVTRYQKEKIKR